MADTVQRPAPAVEVIESEEILQFLDPRLLKVDYTDSFVRATVIGGSFAFFSAVFGLVILLLYSIPAFKSLGLKFRVFMSLSIVRAIYGLLATILGGYAIFYSTNLDRDVVFGKTATAYVSMLATLGFFIFELATVVLSDVAFGTFSKMLITHHSLGVISYSVSIALDANFAIGCKVLILEMSTPFSCLCYTLLKARLEHSLLWMVNQLILIHTFHLRSMVECYLWYVTYRHWAYIWNFMPVSLLVLTYLSLSLVSFLMTPYWGYRKTQQLFNPVDWNFQESRKHLTNGEARQEKKID